MDDETGNGHAEDLREDALGDLGHTHPSGGGPGARPPGLNSFERSVVERAARDAAVEEGRVQFGRYAESHPGALPEGSGRGWSDDDALDALFDTAERFDLETDDPSERERVALAELIGADRGRGVKRKKVDPDVATFLATVPNGGVTTDRNNNWILKLEVDWSERGEITRVIESIPMKLSVKITRVEE